MRCAAIWTAAMKDRQTAIRLRLTPAEASVVKVAAARRNLEHCQDGLFSCDPTELTEAEAKEVRSTFERRNQASCRDGLASCQPLELTGGRPECLARRFSKPKCGGLQARSPGLRPLFTDRTRDGFCDSGVSAAPEPIASAEHAVKRGARLFANAQSPRRCPPLSSRRSQLFANFQSRCTVSGEIFNRSAVSVTLIPPKKRNSTT